MIKKKIILLTVICLQVLLLGVYVWDYRTGSSGVCSSSTCDDVRSGPLGQLFGFGLAEIGILVHLALFGLTIRGDKNLLKVLTSLAIIAVVLQIHTLITFGALCAFCCIVSFGILVCWVIVRKIESNNAWGGIVLGAFYPMLVLAVVVLPNINEHKKVKQINDLLLKHGDSLLRKISPQGITVLTVDATCIHCGRIISSPEIWKEIDLNSIVMVPTCRRLSTESVYANRSLIQAIRFGRLGSFPIAREHKSEEQLLAEITTFNTTTHLPPPSPEITSELRERHAYFRLIGCAFTPARFELKQTRWRFLK